MRGVFFLRNPDAEMQASTTPRRSATSVSLRKAANAASAPLRPLSSLMLSWASFSERSVMKAVKEASVRAGKRHFSSAASRMAESCNTRARAKVNL